jgi:outer membrane lipoprotein-sorting protein
LAKRGIQSHEETFWNAPVLLIRTFIHEIRLFRSAAGNSSGHRNTASSIALQKVVMAAAIAANLTFSCKFMGGQSIRAYCTRGGQMVQQGRKFSRFLIGSRLLRRCAAGMLIGACYAPFALAQGGETEITKTKPSNPPVVAQPVAPPVATAPVPVAGNPKTANPMGGGAAWQAKPQQAATAPVAAQPTVLQESDQQLVTKVNDYFNNMTDLQGDFTQTDPDSKQKRGKLYFQRPGKARFDYAPPSGLKVISDGNNLVIQDTSLNTSERYPLEVTPFKMLLSEKVDLANDAHVVSVEQGPDTFILTVEEKDNPGSGHIRIFFNKADNSLKEWIVTDAQGLDTRLEVSNLKTGEKVASNFFMISAFGPDSN